MSWIKKIFTRTYSKEETELLNFLSQNEIFEKLSFKELERIIPLLYLRNYNENEVVFFSNDPSQAIYIIKEGQVTFNMEYDEKKEILFTKETTAIFGQNGVIKNAIRNYNAIVTSDSASIYVLPQQGLLEVFEKDEKLKAKVMTAFMNYYASYVTKIFSTYRENLGFFEMKQVYQN